MDDLHFLRPAWLLLLLLVPLVIWLWRQGRQGDSGWERLIPHPLLAPLMPTSTGPGARRGKGWWAAVLLTIAAVAMAGPSWRKAPNPLEKLPDSLVVALDLSLSMLATDEAPNRLTRAKQKIRDLVPQRADAFTGLVAYAGDAHVVTPLTDDSRAIENLLPALDPFMMPALGSRADRAVATAIELLQQGGRGVGSILLVTDSIDSRHHDEIQAMLEASGYKLRILGVGTSAGAPIPIPDRGFLRDEGKLITPQLEMAELNQLAEMTDGLATRLTLTDSDLAYLGVTETQSEGGNAETSERRLNLWVDDGYWMAWLLLPLGLIAWRRGGLAVVLFAFTLPVPQTAQALEWDDLWLRPDQQGAQVFPDDPQAAAERFNDPAWRGTALYRAGEFEAAAKAFGRVQGPESDYNRGNALARSGDLEAAIEAYDEALAAEPDHADAAANKALVEDLLKRQKQEEKQASNQDGGQKDGDQQRKQGQGEQSENNQKPSGEAGDANGQGAESGEANTPATPKNEPGAESEAGEEKESEPQTAGQEAEDEANQSAEESAEGLLSDPDAQDASTREQWIRRVPDDPAGLLRRKFLYQYQQKNPETEESQPW